MCTSSSTAFAWVGALLVNLGFITLISWGAATLWPLGFVFSAVYTAFLFGIASWFERREYDQEALATDEGPLDLALGTASDESSDLLSTIPAAKTPVLVSLLYGLAVISVGVTGFFLPVNLIPSCNDTGSWKPKWAWTTNVTSLPPVLQDWARNDKVALHSATFGYIHSTDTTLFSGSALEDSDTCLWSTQASTPPVRHEDLSYPDQFATLSHDTVCFQSKTRHSSSRRAETTIYCSDGTTFRSAIDPTKRDHSRAVNVKASDGLLWFKEFPTNSQESGLLIFSLDPDSMTMLLHSQRVDVHSKSSCRRETSIRKQAIVALLTTALPITLASIALWKVKHVPSMAVTSYLGFTLIYVSLLTMINPQFRYEHDPFKWWFAITGVIWLLVLSYLVLSESMTVRRKEPLRWGLVIGGIAFLLGMMAVFTGPDDNLLRWILLNLFCFVPLIFLGAATDTIFLMFLGAFGFLVDSWRFAMFVGNHMQGEAVFPVQFLIFSSTGLVVGALGFQLSKYQHHVEEWAVTLVQDIDTLWMSRRRSSGPEDVNEDSNPLLPSSTEQF